MPNKFKIKRGSVAPTNSANIDNYELVYNYTDNELWTKHNGSVVKVSSGTNGTVTNVVAGNGLTGGGTTTATLDVGAGTGISVAANSVSTNDSQIVHDNLSGFVDDEHINHSGVSILAGTGLTGGGTIASSRTLNVVGENGLAASANAIGLDISSLSAVGVNNLVDEDLFAVEIAVGGAIKKLTASSLKTYIGGGTITSVSGMTNDYVLTASGSTTLQGESSLRFGGQYLSIQGNDPSNTYGVKEKLRIHRSGNNTDRQLQIYEMRHSGGREFLQAFNLDITTDNSSGYTYTQGSYGGSSYIEFDNAGALKFYNDTGVASGSRNAITPSLSMWVKSDNNILMTGRLGIGWTNGLPNRALDVKGGIELSADDNTLDLNNFTLRRDSSGGGNIDVPGDMTINIDANNNQTDAVFEICANGSATGVFKVGETGIVTTGTWQGTAINATYIGGLPASKITSGAFDIDRLPTAAVTNGDINNVPTADNVYDFVTGQGYLTSFDITTQTDPKYLRSDATSGTITSQDWNTYIDGTEAHFHSVTNHSGSNRPSGAYGYGVALSYSAASQGKFQLYAPEKATSGTATNQGLWYRSGWNTTYRQWAQIWDSTNDGTGSGLDADLLDGNHGSHYLNAGNLTGTLDDDRIPNLAASKITSGTFADARIPSLAASKITSGTFNIARIPTTAIRSNYRLSTDASNDANSASTSGVYRIDSGYSNLPSMNYGTLVTFNNMADTGFQIAADYHAGGGSLQWRAGNSSTFGGSGSNTSWFKIWNEDNDGANSGLDADLLDGNHASAFATLSGTQTFSGPKTFTGRLTISDAGADGLHLNQDTTTNTNSNRLFFTGSSAASAIFQSGSVLSFRSGATAGSSSGTERFQVNTSGATAVGNFTATGNAFVNYGLTVNEGGNDADFRVESQSNANMFRVDASTNRIGIGTGNPADKMHIYLSGSGTGLRLQGAGGQTAIRYQNDAQSWYTGINSSEQFYWYSSQLAATTAFINTDGNFYNYYNFLASTNNAGYAGRDTGGTVRNVIKINSSNQVQIGDNGHGGNHLHYPNTYTQISTNHGYLQIGPQNGSHCHFVSDIGNFYTTSFWYVNNGITLSSYNQDVEIRRNNSSADRFNISADYSRIIVNNSERFRATTSGATVTGNLTVTGNMAITGNNDATTLDGYDSSRFFRRQGSASATVGPGWMTVATNTSGRQAGEILVTDGDSGDHGFIRIHWLRSYQDSNFTVINCGGHQNRITGVRVLSQDSNNTYGEKILQVYVEAGSSYDVKIFRMGDDAHYGDHTVHTPTIENTITGYSLHGHQLENLSTYGFAHEEGILAGGNIEADRMRTSTGTEAFPAYSFEADTDTGIYRRTTNQVGIVCAGEDQFYVSDGTIHIEQPVKFQFANDQRIFDNGSGGLKIGAASHELQFYAGGSDPMQFYTGGISGTERIRLESGGDCHFDQDVIAFSTTPSDKKLKTNIKEINYGLETIMKLNPKEYDWKKDDRHDIGFIAQEVEEVIPEIVKDKKHFDENIKTLDYEKLTAVLIKAVQEQQQQINELKEKLNG